MPAATSACWRPPPGPPKRSSASSGSKPSPTGATTRARTSRRARTRASTPTSPGPSARQQYATGCFARKSSATTRPATPIAAPADSSSTRSTVASRGTTRRCSTAIALHAGAVSLVHPLLDAAERVLGDFAPLLQNLGSGRQPSLHAVEHRLFGPAANPPIGIGRALRLELTPPACIAIAVLHRRVVRLDATIQRVELLSAGAEIGVAGRVVAELLLPKQPVADR